MFVLQGKSEEEEASKLISEALVCRWANVNRQQLQRMPYEERQKLELVYGAILAHKPQLLLGGIVT